MKIKPPYKGPDLPWQIEMLPLKGLKPAQRNARTHSKKQIRELANSISQFGPTSPIVVDGSSQIIAGHARFEAYKLLKHTHVPVIRLSHLDRTQVRALMLADNKLAMKAGWDLEILTSELSDLQIALPEVGLDLSLTGFDVGEIEVLLQGIDEEPKSPSEELPDLNEPPVARDGDLFVLGQHRILVGDARKEESFDQLMASEKATMAFLDPPYNVKIQGHVGGRGRIKHREFSCASGEMTSAQFRDFLQQTLSHCAGHTIDGGITYITMDWRHTAELLAAGGAAYDELKNICVWDKRNPGQGSFYRSQHELVFVYKRGQAPHINTFELGQHGRTRSNVWSYPGANSFRAGRMDELRMHPTVKPVAMIVDAMRDCSRRGSIVLDAFAGVGSTAIAAEQIGRRAFCMEIDGLYVDAAVRRWQRTTGKDAILEATGETFDDLLLSRSQKNDPQVRRSRRVKKTGGTNA